MALQCAAHPCRARSWQLLAGETTRLYRTGRTVKRTGGIVKMGSLLGSCTFRVGEGVPGRGQIYFYGVKL